MCAVASIERASITLNKRAFAHGGCWGKPYRALFRADHENHTHTNAHLCTAHVYCTVPPVIMLRKTDISSGSGCSTESYQQHGQSAGELYTVVHACMRACLCVCRKFVYWTQFVIKLGQADRSVAAIQSRYSQSQMAAMPSTQSYVNFGWWLNRFVGTWFIFFSFYSYFWNHRPYDLNKSNVRCIRCISVQYSICCTFLPGLRMSYIAYVFLNSMIRMML